MNLNDSVAAVLSEIEKVVSSETVIGKALEVGGSTVIPVSRLRFGFAVGTGDVKASQEARGGQAGTGFAGGGVSVDPQAFIVVDGSGAPHLLTLRRSAESSLVRAVQLVPEVVEKVAATGSELFSG
jgi:uncharacterized spore protein YtfJ